MNQAEDRHHTDAADVAETLVQLKAAVRRNAGKAQIDEAYHPANANTLTDLADLAIISAHLPVSWSTPVVGRAVALSKRATRILLRWYINPIVEQQNTFNDAVVRVVASLDARMQEIERDRTAREQHE